MGIAIFIPIVCVLFMAVGLRLATWIYNKLFAHTSSATESREIRSVSDDNITEYKAVEAGPYTAPSAYVTVEPESISRAVPEPSIVKGMGIGCVAVFGLAAIMFFVNAFLLSVLPRPTNINTAILPLFFLGTGFLFYAALLSRSLPTTFSRALGVTCIVFALFALLALGLAVPAWLIRPR